MGTTKWGSSHLLASALLSGLIVLACADSITPTASSVVESRSNGSADASAIQAASQEICGGVEETMVITENTRLTCNVICTNPTGPCIQFGKDHITLWLNGFTMTGPA